MRKAKKKTPLSSNLSLLLSLHRISVRELARIGGVAPASISEWISGRNTGNFLALKRIADYFNTTLDVLLVGDLSQEPPKRKDAGIAHPETFILRGISYIPVQILLPATMIPLDLAPSSKAEPE